MGKSLLEMRFALILQEMGWTKFFEREVRFDPERRWRIDFCDVANKIAVEIVGGTFVQGGHSRGVGAKDDREKYNRLTVLGYRLLQYGQMSEMQEFKSDYPELLHTIHKKKVKRV
jgi:hypothetical protein